MTLDNFLLRFADKLDMYVIDRRANYDGITKISKTEDPLGYAAFCRENAFRFVSHFFLRKDGILEIILG